MEHDIAGLLPKLLVPREGFRLTEDGTATTSAALQPRLEAGAPQAVDSGRETARAQGGKAATCEKELLRSSRRPFSDFTTAFSAKIKLKAEA